MSRRRKSAVCKELIEYRHSYYCFLSKHFPEWLPLSSVAEEAGPVSNLVFHAGGSHSVSADDTDLRLLDLDPLTWKKQDHYLLLGLQHKRYRATAAEVRAAYRTRVLQYHPDKLQHQLSQDEDEVNDTTFKCIFHAYQLLSDPIKRREYDSVDYKAFDDSIPTEDAVPPYDIDGFLKLYRKVFQMNARFSKKPLVPDIGHAHSSREDIEAFYAFWSNFESWRSFEYLDEDESEHAESRADKRWLERKNKANRLKRKNEDNVRIRKLFEQAYRLDPRLIRFREDDRRKKEALRLEKEMTHLRIVEEREKQRREEEQRLRDEFEATMRIEAERKREKEAIEAKLRREKKVLKKLFVDNLYFVADITNVALINERSLLVEKLLLRLPEFESITTEIERRITETDRESIMEWIMDLYRSKYPEQEHSNLEPSINQRECPISDVITSSTPKWTLVETDTLIKAVKTHPGGLRDRWTKITEWYNRHLSHLKDSFLPVRTTEELIKRANEIRQTTEEGQVHTTVPSEAQTDYKALQKKRDPRVDQSTPTITYDVPQWTPDEQKTLEQGLKTCKADDPSRWDKIAGLVGRPKKDCMLRAKEIAQLLKLRKEKL